MNDAPGLSHVRLLLFTCLYSEEEVLPEEALCTEEEVCAMHAGVSVSAGQRSDIQINPDTPEAQALRQWYDFEGRTASTQHAGEGLANAR